MSKQGFIYVAVEEDRPGYCKVGQTTDLATRGRTLPGASQARVDIVEFVRVQDMDAVEKAFHKILPQTNRNKEWFNIETERVLPMLRCLGSTQREPCAEQSGGQVRHHPIRATSDLPGKTPQGEFRQPIVDVLEELGGSGRAKDVKARVGERVQLRSGDLEQYESGPVVWKNSIAWARNKLKDEGILKSDSPRGLWELATALSDKGGKGNSQAKDRRGRRSQTRSVRSGRTPQAEFHQPIMDVLEELGGSGRAKDVTARVGERVQLRSGDLEQYENGQVVWESSVAWARNELKDEGILKADSPWGWWELA